MELMFAIGWEGLVIPAIAFAIWLFSSLFGDKKKPAAPKGGVGRKLGAGNKAQLNDIERFFEEARLRRSKPVSNPTQEVPFSVKPPPVKENPPAIIRKKTGKQPKGSALEIPSSPFMVEQKPNVYDALSIQPPPLPPKQEPELQPVPTFNNKSEEGRRFIAKANPFILEARGLLKSPKALGTAIVLREILQPPLCMRGRNPRRA